MAQEKLSRRAMLFGRFRKSENAPLPPNGDDALFKKYSRKTRGNRKYSTELHDFNAQQTDEAALRVGNVLTGLAPYTGTWGKAEALHLLRRTGFGYKKTDLDTLLTMSMNQAVDLILTVNNTPPPPPVIWYSATTASVTFADENNLAYGANWVNDFFATGSVGQTSNSYRQQGLRSWLTAQALNQDITIREKMMWFWYHFMPVDFQQIFSSANAYVNTNSARICYQYMKMFRDFATGNFKQLIRAMSKEPCMMFYLNNQANTATAPDENFARELMELFTLGKDPLSQYTQADVVAAARVLTGWRVQGLNTASTATNFVSSVHATGNKQFSSFFNNTVIPSTPANAGANEFDELINMIFSKTQVVAEYICRRLYRYFIYYDIDNNIETNVIRPLAQTFIASNWEILPVLKQLFKSEHFFDMANRGVCIKSPFDLVLGTMRTFNIGHNVSAPTNYQAQYMVWNYINTTICAVQEQSAGAIPNVAGWPAFYQEPSFHQYWINSNTIQKRFGFLQTLFTATNGYSLTYNGLTTKLKADVIAWVQQFPQATIQDPNLLVAEVIQQLLPIDLSASQKTAIKQQTLLYQQTTDGYWTTAWQNYLANPTNTTALGIVRDRLTNLIYTILQLAEYQLM